MDHSQQQQPLWSSLEVDASSSLVNSINIPPRQGLLPPTLESLFSTPSSATTSSNNNNATRRNSNNSTKMTAKKKASTATSSSRRRSSLTTTNYYYGRRGHSDMALASSSSSGSTSSLTSSSASGLFRPSSKKRCLRRSISWDVRPPKVHELKRAVKTSSLKEEATATASGNTEDNRDARGGKNNESWYSKQEYSAIIQEQMKSIMIMRYIRENGTDDSEIDPEIYCERGLESYQSKERRHEIDMKRKLHRYLVIQEQTRQAMMGTKDPELLGQVASTQSEGSQMKAQLRAALDQHEAISNSQKPLSEQEKLQVALAQHNRMIMEKQRNGMQQNTTMEESGEIDDPTSGIIPLSSLWAQEGASFPSHDVSSKGAGDIANGQTSNSSPCPSTASYFQANALFKDSPNNHGLKTDRQKPFAYHSSNNINGTNQHSGMPMVGFHGMYQSSAFGSKPSAPVMSPQALHNAFCSSFAHASGPQQEQQEQQQQFHRTVFPSKVNHHNTGGSYPLDSVASIMPTSAFAAMHLQRSQVQQDPPPSSQGQSLLLHNHHTQSSNMVHHPSLMGQQVPR